MKLNVNQSVKMKVVSKMKDHSNDPLVRNKIEKSKKVISIAGLPPEFLRIQAERMKK